MRLRNNIPVLVALAAALSVSPAWADDAKLAEPLMTPAQAIGRTHDCAPYYPREAAFRNESGTVFVTYDVGADGVIRNVAIKLKSGFDDLDAAALACVTQKWRDTPATRNGLPMESPGHMASIAFNTGAQSPDALYRQGAGAVGAEMYPLALGALNQAIQIKPDFKDAYYQRGLAYDHLYDGEHALADYARAGVSPPSPVAPPPTGPAIAIGSTRDCIDYYPLISAQLFEGGQVELQYDIDADGLIANVVLLRSSGVARLDQAALACVREHWRFIPARLNGVGIASPAHKAVIQFGGGEPQIAMQFYTRGRARSSLGDYASAISDFDQALSLAPNLAAAYNARADAYDAFGQHDRADADRVKAMLAAQ